MLALDISNGYLYLNQHASNFMQSRFFMYYVFIFFFFRDFGRRCVQFFVESLRACLVRLSGALSASFVLVPYF